MSTFQDQQFQSTEVLKEYFENGSFQKNGLPTVKYMAAKLALSPRYLGDLVKQETGKTALEHIHITLVMEAKNILMSTNKTVAETAFELRLKIHRTFRAFLKKKLGLHQQNIENSF